MATHLNQASRYWALILTLILHLFVLFGIGVQGSSLGDINSNMREGAKSLKVVLINVPSALPNVLPSDKEQTHIRSERTLNKSARTEARSPKASYAIFEFPEVPEPHYFKASELDEKPQVLADISSDLASHLVGELPQSGILRLLINERGEIDKVVIDESGFSEANQHLVQDAFSKMKFHAGKIGGNPVKSELKIEISLENIVASPYSK